MAPSTLKPDRNKRTRGRTRTFRPAPVLRRDRSAADRAGAALRDSEARLRAILDTAVDGIITIDERGMIESANNAAVRLFGYAEEELIGRNVSILMPEPYHSGHDGYLERYLRTGEAHIIGIGREVQGLRRDGSVFPLDLAVSELRLGGRRLFTGTVRDITERKRLEAQLLQAQKMEGIGRLAGGVAHDFNNLLTAIIGYAELASDSIAPDHESQPYLANVQKAADRAAALTRQLLAFARKQVIEPRQVSMNDIVLDTADMLRRLIGEDIRLVTALDRELGIAMADPNQLEQILVNLVVNARDAMPDGGALTISTSNATLDADYARHRPEVKPGEFVMMAISDTGVGMTEEVRARAFEPFFTTKEAGKGTGLGLSMCYGSVKQSGGHIWVYSEPGEGTTIKVYLPRIAANGEAAQPAAHDGATHGAETVLLVEDDVMVRETAVSALRAHGYTVLEAADGVAALTVASDHDAPIDLLVTDIVMPAMGGKELVRRMSETRPEMLVLYTSGHTDDAIVHHGWLDAGSAFLQKPFAPSALARKVRHVIDAARAA